MPSMDFLDQDLQVSCWADMAADIQRDMIGDLTDCAGKALLSAHTLSYVARSCNHVCRYYRHVQTLDRDRL